MKSTMASASVQPQSGSLDVLLFVRTITASRRKPKRREKEMTNDGRVVCLPLSSTSRRDAERVSTSPLCRWDWQTTQQTTCSLTLINEHTHTHTLVPMLSTCDECSVCQWCRCLWWTKFVCSLKEHLISPYRSHSSNGCICSLCCFWSKKML